MAAESKTKETATAVPTVGRVVHFHRNELVPLAAMVIEVGAVDDPHTATLTVFTANGPRVLPNIPFSADPAVGCWSWTPNNR
jgi:hypothetical protein